MKERKGSWRRKEEQNGEESRYSIEHKGIPRTRGTHRRTRGGAGGGERQKKNESVSSTRRERKKRTTARAWRR